MFKFKNNIKSHVIFNKTVEQIIEELKKEIPKIHEMKEQPELILMICNAVENIIKKSDNCDKKKIVIEVMKSLFNLNNDEITKVDSSIECFWSNNMITKIKRIEKVSKIVGGWFIRKFL
jgi:glycerol-3-phosphate cytidylyltransferase-like family protein